jgi:Flp pilus assembly protein TadB
MMRRETQLIGLAVVGAATLVAALVFGNLILSLPLGLGVGALTLQALAAQRTRANDADRDETLLLLQAATPKLRAGVPIDAAFLMAAEEAPTSVAKIVRRYCQRSGYVPPGSAEVMAREAGPLTQAIIAMIRSCRENGGDVATPFVNLAEMIETDQKLRRRQDTATLHVRAQANGLTVIAALVVLSIIFGSGSSVDYFRETADGRLVMLGSLTAMVWGYVILSALNARIGHA